MRIILSILLLSVCYSTVINVPADLSTIQAGINEAKEGDTVLVAAGTYDERIIWLNINGIKLIGSSQDDCIISSSHPAGAVIYTGPSSGWVIDASTEIIGFTITRTDGTDSYQQDGIRISYRASPMLTNVTISGNEGERIKN